jgi:hypothetical protein
MTEIGPETQRVRRILLAALTLAGVALLSGAYAWWRWGAAVVVETVTRFCL